MKIDAKANEKFEFKVDQLEDVYVLEEKLF